MWIFAKKGFVSIVEDNTDPTGKNLLVRGRFKGDIEALFSEAQPFKVLETPNADYRFRVSLPAEDVAIAMHNQIIDIDYDNFKSAAPHERAGWLMKIWQILIGEQDKLTPPPNKWWSRYLTNDHKPVAQTKSKKKKKAKKNWSYEQDLGCLPPFPWEDPISLTYKGGDDD